MAFVHVKTTDGKTVLIHTSQLDDGWRRAEAKGRWEDVWERTYAAMQSNATPPRKPE